ncbi:MAG TPA: E2/UBC family protein, partial [Polyangia bacterium]
PRTINPGDGLPESDEAFLSEKGYRWKVVKQADGLSLILQAVRLEEDRYDRAATDVMIRVPAGYPLAGLDMFYVEPPLALRNAGYPQGAEQFEEHHGRRWQRFSRHLPSAWRPGVDGLRGFLALVMGELQGAR